MERRNKDWSREGFIFLNKERKGEKEMKENVEMLNILFCFEPEYST